MIGRMELAPANLLLNQSIKPRPSGRINNNRFVRPVIVRGGKDVAPIRGVNAVSVLLQDESSRRRRPGDDGACAKWLNLDPGSLRLESADVAPIPAAGIGYGGVVNWAQKAALVGGQAEAVALVECRTAN